MINIDTHFFLEARHVDFMTTIKERSWFANTTNHDAFRTVSNLFCLATNLHKWTVDDWDEFETRGNLGRIESVGSTAIVMVIFSLVFHV